MIVLIIGQRDKFRLNNDKAVKLNSKYFGPACISTVHKPSHDAACVVRRAYRCVHVSHDTGID